MNPYVKAVRPLPDHAIEVVFESGETRVLDVKPYLTQGVFVRLKESEVFAAVRAVAGSVEWPGGVDLSYDTVYTESRPVGRAESSVAGN
jgi:hypothetical protein